MIKYFSMAIQGVINGVNLLLILPAFGQVSFQREERETGSLCMSN
jgi:hypothetical protein